MNATDLAAWIGAATGVIALIWQWRTYTIDRRDRLESEAYDRKERALDRDRDWFEAEMTAHLHEATRVSVAREAMDRGIPPKEVFETTVRLLMSIRKLDSIRATEKAVDIMKKAQ